MKAIIMTTNVRIPSSWEGTTVTGNYTKGERADEAVKTGFLPTEYLLVAGEKGRSGGGGSAVSLVVSLNLKRRHLTVGQRAQSAAESLSHYEAEAKKRQLSTLKKGTAVTEKIQEREQGMAADHAARDFKVNPPPQDCLFFPVYGVAG